MSTQLSTDISWERPSTRRYAPPGGQSSISLGDYTRSPLPEAPPAESSVALPPVPPTSNDITPVISANGLRVGLAVCQAASLKATTVTELQKLGAQTTVYEVMDPLQLPSAVKCLIANAGVSVVVAIGFLVQDAHWCCKEVAGALMKTLLDLSLETPLVNGLCFSQVFGSDLTSLSERLAVSAVNMGALVQAGLNSYEVKLPRPAVATNGVNGSKSRGHGSKRRSSIFSPPRRVPRELSSLLLGLRTSLKALGTKGIFQLARRFRQSDNDDSGSITFHEFQVCMRDAHMDWTEDELKNVFEHFDANGSGSISYDEFLIAVRGDVSQRRAQLILQVFHVADKNKDGVINARDLKGSYDASKHPDVQCKRRTQDDVMEEFLSTFEGEVKDGKVTPEEWCRYYAMISASIDTDDEFELMMRNAWHLPGGQGALANTSNRRVLATRADGRQTIEEVVDGTGMTSKDTRAMMASLRAQGLNVTAVELFGGIDTTEDPVVRKPVEIPQTPSPGNGTRSMNSSKYTIPVRQGPGGNSSLVLG